MKITITPKDPKLAKNSAVKKWLREVARRIEKKLEKEDRKRIRVLSSFYIPRPENLKVHGCFIKRVAEKAQKHPEIMDRLDLNKLRKIGNHRRSKSSYRGDHIS